jgi:hypothetical protein
MVYVDDYRHAALRSLMVAFDAISKKAWSLCFAAFDNEAWLHSILLLLSTP